MAYRSQLCQTCKHKGSRCYAAPNSCCTAYEKEENITAGNYLANLLTDGKYKEVAKILYSVDADLCMFSEAGYNTCNNDSKCFECWERFFNSEYKGELC